MDSRLIKSITLLILILLAPLFAPLLIPVSEARPLISPLQGKEEGTIIREVNVNGVFRTLKSSGPTPGVGHKLKKLQNLGGMKDSGPTPGVGHKKLQNLEGLGVIKHSGPSPGEGHKHITTTNNNHS